MRRLRTVASLVLAASAGCAGNDSVCGPCPNVAGTYAVAFNDGSANDSAGCGILGIGDPQGDLVLQQTGAGLTGSWGTFTLNGFLRASWTFSLTGTPTDAGAPTDLLSASGAFTPGADAGGSLTGSVTTRYARAAGGSPQTCQQLILFTAQPW